MSTYTHILDFVNEADSTADGGLCRTIFQDDKIKEVVFGIERGQKLSEHTAAKLAKLFFIKGEASLGLGDEVRDAVVGKFINMPPSQKHSI